MKKINPVKTSIILITVFIILILLVAAVLPFLVTWYVEKTQRLETLATTITITCYPCAPFAILILMYLRKILKNIANKEFFTDNNIKYFKYMEICCIIIALITVIAGRFYLPFFMVAATFLFLSLLIFVLRNIFIELKHSEISAKHH